MLIKIGGERDKEIMQRYLKAIYEWVEKNEVKFNDKKFEQMAHGEVKGTPKETYKTPTGEEI